MSLHGAEYASLSVAKCPPPSYHHSPHHFLPHHHLNNHFHSHHHQIPVGEQSYVIAATESSQSQSQAQKQQPNKNQQNQNLVKTPTNSPPNSKLIMMESPTGNNNSTTLSTTSSSSSSSSSSSTTSSSGSKPSYLNDSDRPPHSYIALISMAILSKIDRKILLNEIYDWVVQNFPYYQSRTDKSWRNSIRHNLSLNECFVKVGKASNGRGYYWSIHSANLNDFKKGDFRRRQARLRAKHDRLSNANSSSSSSTTPSSTPTKPKPQDSKLNSKTNMEKSTIMNHQLPAYNNPIQPDYTGFTNAQQQIPQTTQQYANYDFYATSDVDCKNPLVYNNDNNNNSINKSIPVNYNQVYATNQELSQQYGAYDDHYLTASSTPHHHTHQMAHNQMSMAPNSNNGYFTNSSSTFTNSSCGGVGFKMMTATNQHVHNFYQHQHQYDELLNNNNNTTTGFSSPSSASSSSSSSSGSGGSGGNMIAPNFSSSSSSTQNPTQNNSMTSTTSTPVFGILISLNS